jgi:ATP-dependent DNA ligase
VQVPRRGRDVRLRSRPGRDCTAEFPEHQVVTDYEPARMFERG